MKTEGYLLPVPGSDRYATKAFYGVIEGHEIAGLMGYPEGLRELVLERLKDAYEAAVAEVKAL